MKKIKRTIACIMTIVIFLVNSSAVFAAQDGVERNNVRIISIEEAEQAAIIHIKNVMSTNEESLWNNGAKIDVRRAIFDDKNMLECYYFGIKDKDNNDCGYVITGANTSMYPIIEFAEEGESFLDVSIEHVVQKVNDIEQADLNSKNCKLYYMGDMNYAVECKIDNVDSKIYDITTSNIVEMEEVCQEEEETQDYSDMWKMYLEMSTRNSNPPDDGNDYITNPNNYESGYQDSKYYMVDDGFIYYNIMNDFSYGDQVCAPTAATNLCKYWYMRDPSKYGDLFLNCSWNDVFWEMFELMETDKQVGTPDINVEDAYKLYFYDRGLGCRAYFYYGTNNGLYVVDELNNNRPCHLIVHRHQMYGEHSVVALGYSQFTYSNGYCSTYIRIADGDTNYPSRYVWGHCQGNWNYVIVIPD